jgi:hypothetical protein
MYVCSTHTIFERTEGHLVAFIEIAFVSILSRRLVRLVCDPGNQRMTSTNRLLVPGEDATTDDHATQGPDRNFQAAAELPDV